MTDHLPVNNNRYSYFIYLPSSQRQGALAEILEERHRQIHKLGYGPEHDDKHGLEHLLQWSDVYRELARVESGAKLLHALTKAGALYLAAVELVLRRGEVEVSAPPQLTICASDKFPVERLHRLMMLWEPVTLPQLRCGDVFRLFKPDESGEKHPDAYAVNFGARIHTAAFTPFAHPRVPNVTCVPVVFDGEAKFSPAEGEDHVTDYL